MSQLNLGLAIAATSVLLLGLASGYVKNRLWVSEPLIATVIGILAGPAVFDVAVIRLPEEQQTALLIEFTRITLAISIMGAALRLPPAWEVTHWRELVIVLGLGMPLMWLAGSALAVALLGLPLLYAVLVGAVLSPTDPVLADSIVTGRAAENSVPERMRNAITAESGANDGLAVLIVMLPVYLLGTSPAGAAAGALSDWLVEVLLGQVLAAVALGLAMGWIAARAYLWVLRQEHSEHPSILTLAVALTIAVLAIDLLLETAALLAVFVAGLAFNRAGRVHEQAWHENMQDAVARFFDIPIFILLGALLPWSGWGSLGWAGIAFAALILLLRRLPAWLLIRPLLPSVRTVREAAFNGWFGPIGIAALFYAAELQHEPAVQHADRIWHIVSLVVFGSVVLHGISATPLTLAFGRARSAEHPDVTRLSRRGRGGVADRPPGAELQDRR
jgi:sodium/hydrogen antiporter